MQLAALPAMTQRGPLIFLVVVVVFLFKFTYLEGRITKREKEKEVALLYLCYPAFERISN